MKMFVSLYLVNFNICFCDFEQQQNFSFYLPKHLESFEINVLAYSLLIRQYLNLIRFEQQWFMNYLYPYFYILTLQQHQQPQLQNSVNKSIKVEEGLDEQPIESKSTIKSVEQKEIKKKQVNKTRKKNSKKIYNNGHWTQKEHKLYLQFIEKNKEIMMKSDMKKQEKIFKQMSLVIKSRSPSQCRSHHQKFNPF
ncbi:unnamed protein product [Paramecium sonneborni]|uniref:Myb-like domain-containing protein n=1 Tax=Paramecium sonneborni TaxID=65129 RepID=A0A8S1MFF7_9CILI|nr:unnamed protein product [Paramecium sonneborni]